ncbi:hypothetical protein [Methylomonas sp. AM2-LC]|uniref:hypothetical protein n=1 Tax=Methylomonas sp. AM2-LC TaxID=3153301 RepID=UPI0032675CFF
MIATAEQIPLRIALFCMDNRFSKTMEMYLKGPCHGIAVVVTEAEAEIDMIDADHSNAREILEFRRAYAPKRPIILLSLEDLLCEINNTFFIKKPVTVSQIENVLSKIKGDTRPFFSKVTHQSASPAAGTAYPVATATVQAMADEPKKMAMEVFVHKKSVNNSEALPPESHRNVRQQSALELNEGGFTAFLGTLTDIDLDDLTQLHTASFDHREYYLSFVKAAFDSAIRQNRVLKLMSVWKPLLIFPEQRQVWVDAQDKQLRSLACMKMSREFSSNVAFYKHDTTFNYSDMPPDWFVDMDAFLWKLTLWTSKGRFPVELDLKRPVYLHRWPNFTRLVITPDALRITALLCETPRMPLEIASILNTKPKFVFVFLSACFFLGYLGQSKPEPSIKFDALPSVQPEKPKTGLLSKILKKLRGD